MIQIAAIFESPRVSLVSQYCKGLELAEPCCHSALQARVLMLANYCGSDNSHPMYLCRHKIVHTAWLLLSDYQRPLCMRDLASLMMTSWCSNDDSGRLP